MQRTPMATRLEPRPAPSADTRRGLRASLTRASYPGRTRLSLLGCFGAALLASSGAGCDDYGPRVYTAAPYRADLGCLDPYVPIGVVQAQALGSLCEPVCLRDGATLYVSTVCSPYPAEASIEGADAGSECAAALAAGNCDAPAADAAAP
jgi:hypothetical protein